MSGRQRGKDGNACSGAASPGGLRAQRGRELRHDERRPRRGVPGGPRLEAEPPLDVQLTPGQVWSLYGGRPGSATGSRVAAEPPLDVQLTPGQVWSLYGCKRPKDGSDGRQEAASRPEDDGPPSYDSLFPRNDSSHVD